MSLSERLSRLLFIVPYVASRDGVPVAELADKLEVKPAQIEADIELLSMVGKPPLTPDHLIDLYIEDDVVYVDLDQSLSRPPRLTHDEARALVLGAKLVGSQGGLGEALERVINRVVAALNPVDQDAVRSLLSRVAVGEEGLGGPSAEPRRAVETHHELELDYYSASSDQKKVYHLRPLAIITHSGIEYLVALDVGAELHEKLFRLDRMGTVRVLAATFTRPAGIDLERFRTPKLYSGGGATHAEVRFAAKVATLVGERFADSETRRDKDGALSVRLSTSSPAWLARWVLPFGEDAVVAGPDEARAALLKICSEAAEAYSKPAPRVEEEQA